MLELYHMPYRYILHNTPTATCTYYFSEQDNIFSSDDEYPTRYVTKFFTNMDAFNCLMQN